MSKLRSNWNLLVVKPAGASEFSDILTLQPEGADYAHHIGCVSPKKSRDYAPDYLFGVWSLNKGSGIL